MKYGSFFLVLCLLISGCSNEQTKHLGTWKSSPTQLIKGEGSSIKLTFTDSFPSITRPTSNVMRAINGIRLEHCSDTNLDMVTLMLHHATSVQVIKQRNC